MCARSKRRGRIARRWQFERGNPKGCRFSRRCWFQLALLLEPHRRQGEERSGADRPSPPSRARAHPPPPVRSAQVPHVHAAWGPPRAADALLGGVWKRWNQCFCLHCWGRTEFRSPARVFVSLCMYVYMYVYVCVCMYMYVYVRTCACSQIRAPRSTHHDTLGRSLRWKCMWMDVHRRRQFSSEAVLSLSLFLLFPSFFLSFSSFLFFNRNYDRHTSFPFSLFRLRSPSVATSLSFLPSFLPPVPAVKSIGAARPRIRLDVYGNRNPGW